ncbi:MULTISPECIES: hypothetical protein [unclassified Endozoicomonas]|uniref:hypothetical protein n=1 Tax=unclassified Endozoicomonas TaxID=2644528 RepID=UPI003BB62C44
MFSVIPLAPEAICRQDGSTKNDCEKAAIRRFLAQKKHDHPRLLVQLSVDIHTVRVELVEVRWHHPSTSLRMNGV